MATLDPILQFIKQITIDDKPGVAQMSSTSKLITTAQAQPKVWMISLDVVTPPMAYVDYRGFIEDVRAINTANPFSFSLSAAPSRLASQFAYMGTLTPAQVATVTVASQPGSGLVNLSLANLPNNQTNVFRKGDYIQVGNAVRTVTANVNAVGTTATVPLSEPLRTYPPIGTAIAVGTNVVWNNCYFTDSGYPVFGVSSAYSRPGVMTSTGGTFTFIQTRS